MREASISHEAKNAPQQKPADVWDAFRTFEEKAQQGFRTRGDELVAYRGFLDTFWGYLKNPQTSSSPSDEDRDLITKLVYSHEQVATVPIDFLAQTAKRLEESFRESRAQGGSRWRDEIFSLRGLVQHELQAVVPEALLEKSAAEKIHRAATEGAENPAAGEIQMQLLPEIERRKTIEQTAVNLLAKDEVLAADIQMRDSFVLEMQQLIERPLDDPENPMLDPSKFREALQTHDEYFRNADGTSRTDDLYVSAYREEYETIRDTLRALIDEVKSPEFMLERWAKSGKVSPQLLLAFDDVMVLSEVQQIATLVSDQPESVKAALLSSYLERGVSAAMLSEIIEGRYVFPDTLVEEQLDAFIHFYDVYEETVRRGPVGVKRTLVAAALAGMVASSPFLPAQQAVEPPAIEEVGQTQEEASQVSFEELGGQPDEEVRLGAFDDLGERQQGLQSQAQRPGEGQSTGQNPQGEKPQSQQGKEASGAGSYNPDYIKPQNDGIENLEKKANEVIWSLEGKSEKDLWGFYRTHTASFFDSNKKSWQINKDISDNTPLAAIAQQADVKMFQTQFRVNGQTAELPMKAGFLPVKGMLRVEGITGPYSIGQRKDGTYFLRFSDADLGKTISVSVGMKKAPEGAIGAPSGQEKQDMLGRVINIKRLPKEVANMVTNLYARNDISQLAKAKLLEQYIHENFVYSLNPAWSDYYHKGDNATEFLKRVLEVRKTDCDVANTALVMLLREVGIQSRMAFGFAHEGTFLSSKATGIVAAEGHGWVEVWIDGKWYTLDATPNPGTGDKYTEEALKKVLGPQRSQSRTRKDEEAGKGQSDKTPQKGDLQDGNRGEQENGEGAEQNNGATDLAKALQRLKEQEDFNAQLTGIREEIRNFSYLLSGSDDLIEELLLLELLNLGLMGANLAAERKNAALIERLNRKLNERARAYSGDHGISYELTQEEEEKIRRNETDSWAAPFRIMAVPFFEPLRAISNIKKGSRLERFPYKEGSPEVSKAVEPNSVEFFARILGYDETEIKRKLYEDQFQQAYRQVNTTMRKGISDTLERLGHKRAQWRYREILSTALGGLKRPKDINEWSTMRQQVLDIVMEKAQKAKVEDDASRRKEERKSKKEIPGIQPLSRENAQLILDEAFRYKVVLWQMVDALNAALASLPGKGDK
ncbi:MAG: hypothetical protein HY429_01705 [Candidatus Levybacteria bacterium]|nr:hypothetical protein [Candidatus Levybacteria bacterium]